MAKTRAISIREFRENLSGLLREAQEKDVHFVVMRHSEPVVHVTPVRRGDSLEALAEEVADARRAFREGKTYTAQEMLAMLEKA